MGPFILAVGVAALAVRQFGDKDLIKRRGDHLLISGFVLITIGLGVMSLGSSECGSSWGTRGSYSDC